MKQKIEITNSEIIRRINEYIHSERDRKIMKLKLVDGYTHERIAEIMEMSPRHIIRIVRECRKAILPGSDIFAEICF